MNERRGERGKETSALDERFNKGVIYEPVNYPGVEGDYLYVNEDLASNRDEF